MSEFYTVIIGILGILAISGLFVGVTNDAVNFLNSAIGSKAASMKVILAIASLGIIIGVVTSSGMMEVARNGVFYPAQFSFPQIMMLFLGMIPTARADEVQEVCNISLFRSRLSSEVRDREMLCYVPTTTHHAPCKLIALGPVCRSSCLPKTEG